METVDKPSHYDGNKQGITCIDAIESAGYLGDFCAANVMKYIWRYKHKTNPLEDLKKAQKYLEILVRYYESQSIENNGDTATESPLPNLSISSVCDYLGSSKTD